MRACECMTTRPKHQADSAEAYQPKTVGQVPSISTHALARLVGQLLLGSVRARAHSLRKSLYAQGMLGQRSCNVLQPIEFLQQVVNLSCLLRQSTTSRGRAV